MTKPNLNEIDFYFITDSKLTKNSIIDDTKQAIEAGVKIVQYREKNLQTKQLIEEAAKLKEICKHSSENENGLEKSKTSQKDKAIFLINDRIDIALAVNADGVHLGQDDMPYGTARLLLGHDKIIGLTAHNIEEAIEAEELGADYIGASPIYATTTKLDAGKPAGIKLIEDIKNTINIPIVAIGGINLENTPEVIKAGADSVVAMSAVIPNNVKEECKKFINIIKQNKK